MLLLYTLHASLPSASASGGSSARLRRCQLSLTSIATDHVFYAMHNLEKREAIVDQIYWEEPDVISLQVSLSRVSNLLGGTSLPCL